MTATQDHANTTIRHPLDPLTGDEISTVAALVRADSRAGKNFLFVRITLEEPLKADVLRFKAGDSIDRTAFVVLRDRDARAVVETTVSITHMKILSWQVRRDVQASILGDEFAAMVRVIRDDPRWQAAMRLRGVEHFELTQIDPWPSGNYGPADHPSKRRIWRAITFVRTSPTDNGYARPVEGLVVEVDLDEQKVVLVEDHGVVPLPPKSGNYSVEGIKDPQQRPLLR